MREISPAVLLDLLSGKGLGVEYQPIIATMDGRLLGHEALARFRLASGQRLGPDRVFRALHASPLSLFQMEYRVKQLQLQSAPESPRLFLNIDQDAFEVFLHEAGHPMVDLLQHRPGAVVEIIENSSVSDAQVSIAMLRAFGAAGIPLALDDVGALDSLVSFDLLASVDYVKLARDWLCRLTGPDAEALFAALIGFARSSGKLVILEGVETEEQLERARMLGVDAVQGFLFRDRFVEIWQPGPGAGDRLDASPLAVAQKGPPFGFTA
ncbi:EAL domain-containing protein [Marinobacterium marinum]|uniref:EAL domain-containing protein n=1 Tax=Marinobacterium marinum TaxID=2756129 RepID=A0A7W1WZP9_9GAMM|nr:EAL domain-containing protein [Marinobacterium marinum]MBA4503077.1 EAL domain-containing protein [Marinobacterium marinum]